MWFLHSDECAICVQETQGRPRGRPAKREPVKMVELSNSEPGSETDTASENEDETQTSPPPVYSISMDNLRDCVDRVPHTD